MSYKSFCYVRCEAFIIICNILVAKKKKYIEKERCEFVHIKIINAGSKGDENRNSNRRCVCIFFFFQISNSLLWRTGFVCVYGSVIWVAVADDF